MATPSTASRRAACRVWARGNPCPFGSSVFDTLFTDGRVLPSPDGRHYDCGGVVVRPEPNGKLSLMPAEADGTSSAIPSTHTVPMGRARHCPSLGSTPCPTTLVATPRHGKPWVALAVVGLLVDPQQQGLFLTRRPVYMRSFPGAWVFPGGHVETGEGLALAVAREVEEETGWVVPPAHWRVTSVWESVYPTQVVASNDNVGETGSANDDAKNDATESYIMKTHHVVVYLAAELPPQSQSSIRLCTNEVDGAVWLSRQHATEILAWCNEATESSSNFATTLLPLWTPDSPHASSTVPLWDLVGIYPRNGLHGMGQGSLFALQEFCRAEWHVST